MTNTGVVSIVIASYRSGNKALEEAILRVDESPITGVIWNIAACRFEEPPEYLGDPPDRSGAGEAASIFGAFENSAGLGAASREALVERLRDGRDILAPCGYSGAPHGLLTAQELERDVAWADQNPWDSGATQTVGAPSEVLMPAEADVRRIAGLEVYRRRARRVVLGTHTHRDRRRRAERRMVSRREKGLVDFPLITLEIPIGRSDGTPREWPRLLSRALGRSSEEPSVFLLVVDTSPAPVLWFCDRIAELRRRGTEVEVRPFIRYAGDPVDVDAASLDPLHPTAYTPSDRHAWYRAATLRGAVSGDAGGIAGGRDRLMLLRPRSFGATRPEATPPPGHYGADRVLGSSMQGSATIADEVWDVELTGGRLGTIRAGDAEIAGVDTVNSRLQVGGKDLPFDSWGAVSFEGTRTRGLQEHLVLSAPFTPTPGSIIVEYYFVDGFSPLVLDLHTRYPVFDAGVVVNEIAPFEYPIYFLGEDEALLVDAGYPDGSRARATYAGAFEGFVYGQTFSFQKTRLDHTGQERQHSPISAAGTPTTKETGITLRAYDPDSSLIVGIALSVRRCRKSSRVDGQRRKHCFEVRVNLVGSYRRLWSDEISCIEEHMTFLLTPGDRHALAIPAAVKSELVGPWAHERWE